MTMEATAITSSSPEWRRSALSSNSIGSILLRNEKTRNGPPSLDLLDLDKVRREARTEAEQPPLSAGAAVTSAAPPPLVSPSSAHSGPPPPYSYSSSTSNSVMGIAHYLGSPTSRRASEDDKESGVPRLSLPSIHEALGKDPAILYSGPPPSSTVPPPTSYPTTATSPTTPAPRSQPEPQLPGPPNPYVSSQLLPAYSNGDRPEWKAPAPPPPPPPPPSHSHPEVPHSPHHSSRHRPHDPPPHSAYTASPTSPHPPMRYSPSYSASTVPPPTCAPTSQPPPAPASSYRSFPPPPAYSYPSPGPSIPAYHPQTAPAQPPPPWRPDPYEAERGDDARKAATKRGSGSGQHYGESVKRHLEIFDLETSLNEIAENSGRALDFTRHFGRRAHQTQRDGTLSALPSLQDVDAMMQRQEGVLNALARIKEVVIEQQHALAQQQQQQAQQQQAAQQQAAQQQRNHQAQQQKSRDEAAAEPSHPHTPAAEYRDDPHRLDKLDPPGSATGAGGFAGADPKKRKGGQRSAAPGRCHSCNRAETPEWRRGPDGARTLCNACGLHYAKLTRKMGNKASVASSNLRPKEAGSSP